MIFCAEKRSHAFVGRGCGKLNDGQKERERAKTMLKERQKDICVQSYKHSTIINCDFTLVVTKYLVIITTRYTVVLHDCKVFIRLATEKEDMRTEAEKEEEEMW